MKKNFIRTISLVLALVMSFSLMTTAFAAETDAAPDDVIGSYTDAVDGNDLVVWYDENGNIVDFETPDDAALVTSFSDVKSSAWYYKDVMECAKLGIVAGFEDGSFRPENNVTSVQFIVMLTRTFYNSDVENYKTKPMAAKNAWYWPNLRAAQLHALDYDITVDETAMNRYDMARALVSLLANKNLTLSSTDKKVTNAIFAIKDWNSIPANRQTAVSQCYAQGIITGMSDGTFSGKSNMTRAQACTVIMRMLKLVNNYNPGDADNDQYDDGKTQANGTLANGKPATVENVQAILEDIRKEYPNGTIWGQKGTANNNYYAAGPGAYENTRDVGLLRSKHPGPNGASVGLQYACGGWAAMLSERIFGYTGAPGRQVTSISEMRPGDIIFDIDPKTGACTHISICYKVGQVNGKWYFSTTGGNVNGKVSWNDTLGNYGGSILSNQNITRIVYTRYPA